MATTSQAEVEKIDWLHTIDLPSGYTTKGRYDWRPYLGLLDMGELKGKSVLDVGAADGYFSFEFEKLGAKVTALDIPSQEERDNNLFGAENVKTPQRHVSEFESAFFVAKELLDSQVEHVELNLYDLHPDRNGVFDIVFCSDVLLHLTDPFRALCAFATVCRERLVIATPLYQPGSLSERLASSLLGKKPVGFFKGASRSNAFWLPSMTCLEQMVEGAGFSVLKSVPFKPEREHAEYCGIRAMVSAARVDS